MASYLNTISPRFLLALVTYIEEQGLQCTAALSKAGLNRSMLELPYVPLQSVAIATHEILQESGRSDLGFACGRLTNLNPDTIVMQLLLSAQNLREALLKMAQYSSLYSPAVRMEVRETSDRIMVNLTALYPMPYDHALVLLEAVAVSIHRHVQFAHGDRQARCDLNYSWAAPPHASLYQSLPATTARFGIGGALRAEMHYAKDLAYTALPMADANSQADAERRAHLELQLLSRDSSYNELVRHLLMHLNYETLTQKSIAQMLRISTKTLARHLEFENTRFNIIAQQVRKERAQSLLSKTSIPVGEIALMLGYSTAANFTRGFRSITGQTPSAFRASSADQAAHLKA